MTTTSLHDRHDGNQRDLDTELASTLATRLEGLRADETVHAAAIAALDVEIESAALEQRVLLCARREEHVAARNATLAAIREIEDSLAASRAQGAPVDTSAVVAVQRELLCLHETVHTAAISALDTAIEAAPKSERAALRDRRAQHLIARSRTRVAIQHSTGALTLRTHRLVVRRLPCVRASRRARHVARTAARATAGPDGDGDGPAPRRRALSTIGGAP